MPAPVVAGLLALLAAAFVPNSPVRETKIAPALLRRMTERAPGERFSAYATFERPLRGDELARSCKGLPVRQRRARIAAELQSHAASRQAEALGILARAAHEGRAGAYESLWIGNALVFEADASVLEELAALPEVTGLHSGEMLLPQQLADASLSPSVASYPFRETFESQSLGQYWSVEATGHGYAQVTSAFGPSGSGHLVMATSKAGEMAIVRLTLTVDLAGRSDVVLRFLHKELNDESHPEDGVFVSPNGESWTRIVPLLNGSGSYVQHSVDLDSLAASHGIAYTQSFRIRFQWKDDCDLPTDGFAFDEIELGPSSSAGEPTPNLISHQAPRLWELGHRGQGVLLGAIDLGADWTHPDLVARTWRNPAEVPGNGVDDDGNGKVDDIVGWDFAEGDGDPSGPLSHGTQAAGIAVGDGSLGAATGMAPGSSIVHCRVLSETDYWLAQQYLLSVGVDVITSSVSFKWNDGTGEHPDYHMHRLLGEIELAAGIVHVNSIGNCGTDTTSYPVPFNVSAPGCAPSPFPHPEDAPGGRTALLGCGAVVLADDSVHPQSGRGPSAWEDMTLYDASYEHAQTQTFWDYARGGFGGSLAGLLKPDLAAYTDVTSTTNGGGYGVFGGTSAAAPHVAGALCLLREVQPAAFPRHLTAALLLTAKDLGPPGKDNRFGAGLLRAFDAARRLRLLCSVVDQEVAPGAQVRVDVHGPPNALVLACVGPAILDGEADVNLTELHVPRIVALDVHGTASYSFVVPPDPALIGTTVWIQIGTSPPDATWGPAPLISVPDWFTIRAEPTH